ncbi:hypothetical protein PENTCL1PPCAC_7586, partial [Pristionchus entomophagus]
VSNHIHVHFNYYPYKCNDCDLKFVERADLDEHMFGKDHNGNKSVDPYKHKEVERKIAETLFAAKNGMDKLLRKNDMPSLSLPNGPVAVKKGVNFSISDDEEEKTASTSSIAANKTLVTGEIKKEKNERNEGVEESTPRGSQVKQPTHER